MPEPSPATPTASLAGMQAAFDALLTPTGFQRTRKMLWVQRHAHTASFVFLQREGAGRASIDTSLALRLQAGVRVLDSDFPALSLNGHPAQGRAGLDHLGCFGDQGLSPAIKGQPLGRGLFEAYGIGSLKPGMIGPDQSPSSPGDPGGSLLTV